MVWGTVVMSSLHALSETDGLLTNRMIVDAKGNALKAERVMKPRRCLVPVLGTQTQAEIIARTNGACFFFRTHLGTLPFTAQAPAERQLVLDVIKLLKADLKLINSDIDVVLSGKGDVHLRGSLVTETQPTLETFLTALAQYAQSARAYVLELKPLLH
jgi:hypothetical protein